MTAPAPPRRLSVRARPEDAIQRDIVAYLRLVLPECAYRVFSVPNGGGRSKVEAGVLKATGVLAGVPDIEIAGPGGRCYRIEVKTPEGRISQAQNDFIAWMIKTGSPYVIARSIDDAKAALAHWRLYSREAA